MPIRSKMFVAVILTGVMTLLRLSDQCFATDNLLGANILKLYVRPESTSKTACPGLPCETLDYYANVSHSNNTLFMLLPGVHWLTQQFTIKDLHFIQLIGTNTENGTLGIEKPNTSCLHPQIYCNKTNSPTGFVFLNIDSLTIQNLNILYCGQTIPKAVYNVSLPVQAAVALKEISELTMHSVTVQNSSGYGVVAEGLYGNSNILECHFLYNMGKDQDYVGGNFALKYKNCSEKYAAHTNNVSVSNSTFMYGNTRFYTTSRFNDHKIQATGLAIDVSCTNVHIHVSNVSLEHNVAHGNSSKGGNLHVTFLNKTHHTNNSIVIENSQIMFGVATIGGGAYIKYFLAESKTNPKYGSGCENNIIFRNTNFTSNKGSVRGGAMYILFKQGDLVDDCPKGQVTVEHCYFSNNILSTQTADGGAAINIYTFFINGVITTSLPYFTVYIKECHFVHNSLIGENQNSRVSGGAALYVGKHRREIFIVNSTFEDNAVTAISAFRSNIVFQGRIIIRNNTGMDGGGLILCEGSYMLISQNTDITFENNVALHLGGAIYAEDQCLESHPTCFYQIYTDKTISPGEKVTANVRISSERKLSPVLDTIHIRMINNTAVYAGSQIYGGSMDYCYTILNFMETHIKMSSLTVYRKIFNESRWEYDKTDLSFVTSYPRYVCFCDGESQKDFMCGKQTLQLDHKIFPGESITVSIVAVGQFENAVPATILAITSSYIEHRTIHGRCTNLTFTVNSNKTCETLTLFTQSSTRNEIINGGGRNPRFVRICYKCCPSGIMFNTTTKTCNISESMYTHGYKYYAEKKTLFLPGGTWVGVQNASDNCNPGIYRLDHCPSLYCKQSSNEIKVNETYFDGDSQCEEGRGGRGCGACEPPYSVPIASDKCLRCDFSWKKAYLFLLGLAYFAISFIVVLFLVALNITITNGTLSGFIVYTSIFQINRYIFVPRPQHENMLTDTIAWINLDIGLHACFYDGFDGYYRTVLQFFTPILIWINVGLIIFLSSRSSRIAAIVGTNAVKVLATLFLLSYTKILQTEVAVFSCIKFIDYQDQYWLRDANVPCWEGKHLGLVIIGVLFGIVALLYTLVLLFVQPLQRYSHYRALRWFARIKPFIDAYTCPHVIKDRYRFWTGLLLLLRIICVIFFAIFAIKNEPQSNLVAVIFICAIIFTLVWSFGGIYKTWWLNVLNSSFYLNIIGLSTLTWYSLTLWNSSADDRAKELASKFQYNVTVVSAAIALLTFFFIIVYHVCKRSRETGACSCCVARLSSTRLGQSLSMWYLRWKERRYQAVPQQDIIDSEEDNELDYDRNRELQEDFENGIEKEIEDEDANNMDDSLLQTFTYTT